MKKIFGFLLLLIISSHCFAFGDSIDEIAKWIEMESIEQPDFICNGSRLSIAINSAALKGWISPIPIKLAEEETLKGLAIKNFQMDDNVDAGELKFYWNLTEQENTTINLTLSPIDDDLNYNAKLIENYNGSEVSYTAIEATMVCSRVIKE